MNAPNMNMSIVSNVRKPVTSARKNVGTWQRNNTYPPWPEIPPAMEQSTDMAMTKREGLTFVTSELNESRNAETAGMIALGASPATVRVICTNDQCRLKEPI